MMSTSFDTQYSLLVMEDEQTRDQDVNKDFLDNYDIQEQPLAKGCQATVHLCLLKPGRTACAKMPSKIALKKASKVLFDSRFGSIDSNQILSELTSDYCNEVLILQTLNKAGKSCIDLKQHGKHYIRSIACTDPNKMHSNQVQRVERVQQVRVEYWQALELMNGHLAEFFHSKRPLLQTNVLFLQYLLYQTIKSIRNVVDNPNLFFTLMHGDIKPTNLLYKTYRRRIIVTNPKNTNENSNSNSNDNCKNYFKNNNKNKKTYFVYDLSVKLADFAGSALVQKKHLYCENSYKNYNNSNNNSTTSNINTLESENYDNQMHDTSARVKYCSPAFLAPERVQNWKICSKQSEMCATGIVANFVANSYLTSYSHEKRRCGTDNCNQKYCHLTYHRNWRASGSKRGSAIEMNLRHDFRDLIKKMCERNASERIGFGEILNHNFFKNVKNNLHCEMVQKHIQRLHVMHRHNIKKMTDPNKEQMKHMKQCNQAKQPKFAKNVENMKNTKENSKNQQCCGPCAPPCAPLEAVAAADAADAAAAGSKEKAAKLERVEHKKNMEYSHCQLDQFRFQPYGMGSPRVRVQKKNVNNASTSDEKESQIEAKQQNSVNKYGPVRGRY